MHGVPVDQFAEYPPARPRKSREYAPEPLDAYGRRPDSQANPMYQDAASMNSRNQRNAEPLQQYPSGEPRPTSLYPDAANRQMYYDSPRHAEGPRGYPQYAPDRPPSPSDPDPFYMNSNSYAQPIPRNPSPSSAQRGPPQPGRPPSPPMLNQAHLRPGKGVALLAPEQTLALYRSNAKKTSDPDLIFEFAVFMLDASKSLAIPPADANRSNQLEVEKAAEKMESLIREALSLLKRIADRGHVLAQYTLADCYSNGMGTPKARQDFDRAFPLFVLAAKHGHVDAAYRAGTCCENGWGCRRDSAKAVQFFRKAAAAQHPGAMYRLGLAELNGELGLSKNAKEGVKWLKRSAEGATEEFPHALHELALCHEKGIENVVFVDYEYAAELLGQAADLGYAPSAYRLGECYEYGRMGCPMDPALSIHYYVRERLYVLRLISDASTEYSSAAESSRCLLCVDSLVSRWLA